MAVQIDTEELKGCPAYLDWMVGKVYGEDKLGKSESIMLGRKDDGIMLGRNCATRSALGDIASLMFDTDFICGEMKEDEIRATDAMELRRRYADEVGSKLCKSERDIDRIWKSVHGKCSVLELVLSLCFRLDEMVNEDEPGTMVGLFFGILAKNLGFSLVEKRNSDDNLAIVERFLKREYAENGSNGGLFPLKNWSKEGSKDQRNVSIWYQMNTWLSENLDEEEHFLM